MIALLLSAYLDVIAQPRIGTGPVTVIARIRGDESEQYYCPAVELWIDGNRVSSRESDCPPYEEREDYPRSWSWRLVTGPGEHVATVHLLRASRVFARKEVLWTVVD